MGLSCVVTCKKVVGKISEQLRAFLAIDIDEQLFDKIREIQDSLIQIKDIGTGDGSNNAISLAEDLKKKLKTLGMKITNKKFTPHATIARVKSKRNTRELARSIQELSEIKIGTMMVTSFKLKKSELRRGGPIYTDLKIRQLEPLQ